MSVPAKMRWTSDHRCPICGGSQSDPRGQERRCIGYLSGDGEYARCSREEHAGALPIEDTTQTYVHRLTGECRCGGRHGAAGAERPKGGEQIVAVYPYLDEKGVHLYDVLRIAPKTFRPRRPDGKRTMDGVRRVLYRLPELLAADASETVFVVEGEKDVDNLRRLGLVATTNVGGAGKWRPEYHEALRGRRVVVIQDCDDASAKFAGQRHAEQVVKALKGSASSVSVMALPGPGKDASDWIAAGGTAEMLRELARGPARPRTAKLLRLSDVVPSDVRWLWPARIPAGMLAVLDGAAGAGKSSVVIDLAARISTGRPWPASAGHREPRDVILLGHEDSPQHTVRPRLDAAGADSARVHMLEEIAGRLPRFPDDAAEIEGVISETGAALLVIDPISAYIGEADMHRDSEVRAALAPLVGVAERTGAAIVMIRHLRKAGGVDAMSRGLGSVAISALARANMILLRDPDDQEARILAWACLRVAAQPASIRWRFSAGGTGKPPRIAWDDVACALSADEILERADDRRARPDSAGGEAERFLREALADGPLQAADLDQRAEEAGINMRTLKRARQRLGVRAYKMGRTWWAELARVPSPQGGTDVTLGTVGTLGEEGQGGQERQGSLLGALSPLGREPGSDDGEASPSWEASQ